MGYADGINRYAYVGNNPINFNDPNGLWAKAAATWTQTQGISYVQAGLDAVTPASSAFQQSSANYQAGNTTNAALWGLQGGLELGAALATGGEYQAAKSLVANETTTLFRAVSEAELNDIASNGLRVIQGGYETGKLFATSLEDAAKFGKGNFKLDSIQNYLVRVDVPNSVMDAAHTFTADGMRAVSIAADKLNELKATFVNYSPWVKR